MPQLPGTTGQQQARRRSIEVWVASENTTAEYAELLQLGQRAHKSATTLKLVVEELEAVGPRTVAWVLIVSGPRENFI